MRVKYLGDGIFAGTIDDVVHRSFAANIIHADKLKKARVNEAHTDTIPNIHGGQIWNHRQRSSETIRRCEEIQHGCHAWKLNKIKL